MGLGLQNMIVLLCSLQYFGNDISYVSAANEKQIRTVDSNDPNYLAYEPGHLKPFGSGRPIHSIADIDGFPTVQQFYKEFVSKQLPLKMVGGAKLSKGFSTWTDDYFLSMKLPEGKPVLIETKKKENRNQPATEMPFQDFIKIYNQSEYYMVANLPDFLRQDVLLPGPLQCPQIYEEIIVDSIMWFSSGGTKSVVHTDSVDNINCVFKGTKQFVMVDPALYRDKVDIDHPEGAYSDIDVDRVDYTKYPGLAEVEYYHVNLSEGDCLYIPYKWIHQVRSLGRNIAVNVWWDHYKNKNVNPDQCPTSINLALTMDKVPIQGFGGVTDSLDAIRDHFVDYTQHGPLDVDSIIEMIAGDPEELARMDAGRGYQVPIRQIFLILDQNSDNLVSQEEILGAPDSELTKVQDYMRQFEAIMFALEERWAEIQGDPDEDWIPDDDVRDEL